MYSVCLFSLVEAMNKSPSEFDCSTAFEPVSPKRILSIQPDFADFMFDSEQEIVTARQTRNDLHAVIAHWCIEQDDLPDGFCDKFTISSMARQIVPAVVISVQRSSRKLISKLIPFNGSGLSPQRFDPSDLFALLKIDNRCEFPKSLTKTTQLIAGNETLKVCDDCGGAGANLCEKCDGAGTLKCTACSGGGQIACGSCRGRGEVLVDGINTQSCSRCYGRGTSRCQECLGKGASACTECVTGTVSCETCGATGKMRQQWYLSTLTNTQTYHHLVCRNGWVDGDHNVALDSVLLRFKDWPDPQYFSTDESRTVFPDCLSGAAKVCLNSIDFSSTDYEQSTGLRLELRASYVYHVETHFEGKTSEFFVSGCSNTVTPVKVIRRKRGLLGRITDQYAVSPEEREYARRVKAGDSFLTDTRGLENALRKQGVFLEISDTGYVISAETSASPADIHIHFDYDKANQPILRTTIELGPAERQRFPEYMAINQELSIGTLGLIERNNRSIERLVLVDSRFYDSVSFKTFPDVLQLLAGDAHRLIESNFSYDSDSQRTSSRTLKRICDFIRCNLRVISLNAKVSIASGQGQALLKFNLGNGRTQTVLLALRTVPGFSVVELKSRCRAALNANAVRSGLKNNLLSPCGGFALDITSEPATVDLVQRLIAINGEPDYSEFLHSLSSVVHRADAIEQTQSESDQF